MHLTTDINRSVVFSALFMVSDPVKMADQIRFGEDFELDLRAYELRRHGRVLKLERIPMELLLLLIKGRGQLVARDQNSQPDRLPNLLDKLQVGRHSRTHVQVEFDHFPHYLVC